MRKAHTGYQGACKIRHFEEYVKGLGSGRKKNAPLWLAERNDIFIGKKDLGYFAFQDF